MVPDDLIHAFRALPTNDSRRDAVRAVAAELSPYEWRDLQSFLNKRTFHYDIVAHLPVELVSHIFSYLDVSTPFRLQRHSPNLDPPLVSRRWNALLRSPDILKRGLRGWYDESTYPEDSEYDRHTQKAYRIHRFLYGKPVATITDPAGDDDNDILAHLSVLVDDLLVGVSSDAQRTLIVINLQTQKRWHTCGDARERIGAVAASAELVTFSTSRLVCYVLNRKGTQKKRFRLTSNLSDALSCRGRTVVCGGKSKEGAQIYIWDFDSEVGKSFRISYDQSPFMPHFDSNLSVRLEIIPDPCTQTLIVFSISNPIDESDVTGLVGRVILYTRFTFDGRAVADGVYPLPGCRAFMFDRIQPSNDHGGFGVVVDARHDNRSYSEDLYLQFDERTFMFTPCECPTLAMTDDKPPPGFMGKGFAWWKNTFYQAHPDLSIVLDAETSPILAHIGTSNEPRYRSILPDNVKRGKYDSSLYLLLNERFAVVIDQRSIHVAYF